MYLHQFVIGTLKHKYVIGYISGLKGSHISETVLSFCKILRNQVQIALEAFKRFCQQIIILLRTNQCIKRAKFQTPVSSSYLRNNAVITRANFYP